MKVKNPADKASERKLAYGFMWYGFVFAVTGAFQFGIGASFMVGGILAFVVGLANLLQPDT